MIVDIKKVNGMYLRLKSPKYFCLLYITLDKVSLTLPTNNLNSVKKKYGIQSSPTAKWITAG